MDENRTPIEILVYRRNRLDWKYEQIKSLLAGSDESFKETILTKSGKYSKTKVNKLVDDLIECLKEYRSYRVAAWSMLGNKIMKPVTLTKKEQAFYEAFFRVITGLALYNPNAPEGKRSASGTWNAIIERMEMSPDYTSPAELYRDIICYFSISGYSLSGYTFRIPDGFCYDLMCAYYAVTGRLISELITDADRKKAYSMMTDKERKLLEKEEKQPGTIAAMARKEQEENDAAIEEYYNDIENFGEYDEEDYFDPNDLNEFEMEEFLDSITYQEDDDQVENEWVKYFADKDQFINDCRILLEQIPDMYTDHNLRDESLNAVYLYLSKNGITGWLDDDEYFTVYTYLNKTLKASRNHMERKR